MHSPRIASVGSCRFRREAILFDENLAPSLVESLAELFPSSVHTRDVGLKSAPDDDVWDYAAAGGYVIISKDADFRQRSFVYGHPPKVIWLRVGNCSTRRILELLRRRHREIENFYLAVDQSFLLLG